MRLGLVGALLIGCWAATALGQAAGEVESIGFNGVYRPDCWTPMRIRLTSHSPDPQSYQIQIVQTDLDRDNVLYTQTVDLGGSSEGHESVERYWCYFRPRPTDHGLPEKSVGELAKALAVNLCDKNGKVLDQLKLTSTVESADPARDLSVHRGQRLMLCVSDSSDVPSYDETYTALGLMADVEMVPVGPDDLPDDVIGYQGVDAVVWFSADAAKLTQGTRSGSLAALQAYVTQGGTLCVCQPIEAAKIAPLAPLLPIQTGIESGGFSVPLDDRPDLDVLKRIANAAVSATPWPKAGGPFKTARCLAAPGAIVDEWVDWKGFGPGPSRTPYLARIARGYGSVIWCAQDLGETSLRSAAPTHWTQIWNRVFDFQAKPILPADYSKDVADQKNADWNPSAAVDVGQALYNAGGLELESKTAYLVSIAVLFFVVYWIVAGPGLYLLLRQRGQAELNWFAFGGAALAATGATIILVQAVLRGKPQLRHVSDDRLAPDQPEIIHSGIGLYIPRDGDQTVELTDMLDRPSSYIVPLALHPQYLQDDTGFAVTADYTVPVHKSDSTGPVAVAIPYRSTLKKLEINWVGAPRGGIAGAPKLALAPQYLTGILTNNTGHDLAHVFLAFRSPVQVVTDDSDSETQTDYGIALGDWKSGAGIDLSLLMNHNAKNGGKLMSLVQGSEVLPWKDQVVWAPIGAGWSGYWESYFVNNPTTALDNLDDSFLVLSLFDRILPQPNDPGATSRVELFSGTGRLIDMSQTVADGQLLVLGIERDVPLPAPMLVNDQPPGGAGTTLVQAVVPLDRTPLEPPFVVAPPTTQNNNINQYRQSIDNAIQNADHP